MDGEPVSPAELSKKWNESISNVAYHFRVLSDLGVLEFVKSQPVRGSTEHFYIAAPLPDWAHAILALDD